MRFIVLRVVAKAIHELIVQPILVNLVLLISKSPVLILVRCEEVVVVGLVLLGLPVGCHLLGDELLAILFDLIGHGFEVTYCLGLDLQELLPVLLRPEVQGWLLWEHDFLV